MLRYEMRVCEASMQRIRVTGQLIVADWSKSSQADSLAWDVFRPLCGLGETLTPGSAAPHLGLSLFPPALLAR